MGRFEDFQEIFCDTQVLVLGEVVEMKSGHMEEVKEDQDLAKASSLITEAIQEHVILPLHQGLQQTIILNLSLPPGFEIMS